MGIKGSADVPEIDHEIFRPGYIEVYVGPMRSKKTSLLFDRLDEIGRAGLETKLFKCGIDTRVRRSRAMARDTTLRPCIALDPERPEHIFKYLAKDKTIRAVGIDEFSFFNYSKAESAFITLPDRSYSFVRLVQMLKEELGLHVLLSGLNQDFAGRPLGCAGDMMAIANKPETLTGNCMYKFDDHKMCGKKGTRTQRLLKQGNLYVPAPWNHPVVYIEDLKDSTTRYEQRCDVHHQVPERPIYWSADIAKLRSTE